MRGKACDAYASSDMRVAVSLPQSQRAVAYPRGGVMMSTVHRLLPLKVQAVQRHPTRDALFEAVITRSEAAQRVKTDPDIVVQWHRLKRSVALGDRGEQRSVECLARETAPEPKEVHPAALRAALER